MHLEQHDVVEHLRQRLGLTVATWRREREERHARRVEHHRRTQCVIRALAGRYDVRVRRIQRERAAAIVKQYPGAWHHSSTAKEVEETLDQHDDVSRAVR